MLPRKRFLIGGLGALMPVLVSILALDIGEIISDPNNFTYGDVIGSIIRYIILFLIGGIVAYFHEDETKPFKLFEIGVAAPALISSIIIANNANVGTKVAQIRVLSATSKAYTSQFFSINTAYASEKGNNVRDNSLPLSRLFGDIWRGLSGKVYVRVPESQYKTPSFGTFHQRTNARIENYPLDGSPPILAYNGTQQLLALIEHQGVIYAAFSGGGIYRSQDGRYIGGGGQTIRVYHGSERGTAMISCRNGIYTAFSGGGIYFSPDGNFLGGGGNTKLVYSGRQIAAKLLCLKDFIAEGSDAVQTIFEAGASYISPDGKNLGGGGNTKRVNPVKR